MKPAAITSRRVLSVAIPILFANVTVPILGAVDTGVIGQLGEAAPPANPHNEELDRWITIVVWIVIGLALLLAALNILPLLIGFGS